MPFVLFLLLSITQATTCASLLSGFARLTNEFVGRANAWVPPVVPGGFDYGPSRRLPDEAERADLRVPMTATGKLAISGVVVPERAEVDQLVEIRCNLSATYENPFHRTQVELNAEISGPKGIRWSVPGFFYQAFERKLVDGRETLRLSGDPEWRVRFRPTEAGTWTIRLRAFDSSGKVEAPAIKVEVRRSTAKGSIRPSKASPEYLEYADGSPFFVVGLNLAWPGERGLDDYKRWLGKFAENGGNVARVWSFPGWLGLEWSDRKDDTWRRGTYYGLGKYSLDNAWLLDQLLDIAHSVGIKILLCLGTYGELMTEKGYWNEQLWHANPYNAELGGPCRSPQDFFTDLKARAYYRRKLLYLSARYAAHPALLGWELWNEVQAPDYWVHEMSGYLRSIDPYEKLVTTSYGSEQIWRLRGITAITTHLYGDGTKADTAERIADLGKDNTKFGKPHLLTELGIDFAKPDTDYDPEGLAVNLRTGLWQAAASGFAGGAFYWWWDTYIAAKDLWSVYKPFADAVKRVAWNRSRMQRAKIDDLPEGLAATGVIGEHAGFVWLRAADYDWKQWPRRSGNESAREAADVVRSKMAPGSNVGLRMLGVKGTLWEAIWWDTHRGREIKVEEVRAMKEVLELEVPEFPLSSGDVALLLRKLR